MLPQNILYNDVMILMTCGTINSKKYFMLENRFLELHFDQYKGGENLQQI